MAKGALGKTSPQLLFTQKENLMSINPIHTPCKKCVFAAYEGKTQLGCSINYLDKYKEQGAEVLDVYDEDLEFHVINDKKCPGYREDSWFKSRGMEEATLEEKIEYFKTVNKLHYLLVVNFKECGDSEENMKQLLDDLSALEIKPQKIVFIRDKDANENTSYSKINNLMRQSKINGPWRIQNMVDDTVSNENILHSVINLNKPYRFVCALKKLPSDVNDIINAGNDVVHNQLNQFSVISNVNESCLLFSAGVYRFSLAENQTDILEDKDNFDIV
jgi:hypothetical protein